MRSALLLAVAALPAAAAAAVPAPSGAVVEVNNFSAATGSSYVNAAQCAGTDTLHLEWSIVATGSTVFGANEVYKIFASNTAPPTTGTGANFCAEADVTGGTGPDIKANLVTSTPATKVTEDLDVAAAGATGAVAAAGLTCDTASDTKVLYICAHWYDAGANRKGHASGKFIVQLAAPDPPTGIGVGVGPGSLEVSWTPSTGGAVIADHYIAEATPVDASGTPLPGATPVFSDSVNGRSVTISGLTDGQAYSVVVRAYSVGGNPSAPSSAATGTPQPVQDFWEVYKNAGGREQGGCGAGGAGPAALVAVAGLLAALRRRK